ncbi:SEL1-like repeat protein [Piscinibacter aquaticus]|uniref:SEL1-like repeat protein n=1 Tax=Piscinibacter aquaticus TaxID=392597 RepID=A0A5C6U0K2_9BURK|nr:SEL1-like repeat protein [Piscinibacter aquaticus]
MKPWRTTRLAMLAMLLQCSVVTALAAPEDEHRRALEAYNRGDVATAMSVLRAPARAGHAPSQSLLAFMLDRGDFIDEAAALYRQAAAQDDTDALYALANFHLTGRGVAKDEKQALALFSKAAELGHAASIQVLADARAKGLMGLPAQAAKPAKGGAR